MYYLCPKHTTMIYLIVSVVIFVSYLSYIYFKYGIQRSISASYHNLSMSGKWMFTLSTWGYVMPLMFAGVSGNTLQDLVLFLSGFLLCTVGVMADDQSETQKKWHSFGAEGGIMVGILWCILVGQWMTVAPAIIIAYVLFKKKPKNHTGWIEIVSYFSIVASILFKLLS